MLADFVCEVHSEDKDATQYPPEGIAGRFDEESAERLRGLRYGF